MNIASGIRRVSKDHPCPVCGRGDWCGLIGQDQAAPDGAVCMRVESARQTKNGGWLHWLRDRDRTDRRPRPIVVPLATPVPAANIAELARRFQADADSASGWLAGVATGLELTVPSLRMFGVGLCAQQRCSTWPMADSEGRIVGINRRFADGSKRLFAGHHAGLYMPSDLPDSMAGYSLLVCEGGSDAVAGLDLDFLSVGRFSCSHGSALLLRLVRRRRPAEVVVIADQDAPGRRGAETVATALLPFVGKLKLIQPPTGIKDLRAWRIAGLTAEGLRAVVAESPACSVNIIADQARR